MGNKLDPVKIALVANTAKLIVSREPRSCVRIKALGVAIGLHRKNVSNDIADFWPHAANTELYDEHSGDAYWAIAGSNTDIWVWITQ